MSINKKIIDIGSIASATGPSAPPLPPLSAPGVEIESEVTQATSNPSCMNI